jgi:hypothetical protein
MHHLDQARCGRGTVVTSSVSLAGTEHGEYALRPILHTQHPLPPQLGSSQGLGEAGQYSVCRAVVSIGLPSTRPRGYAWPKPSSRL